MPDEAIQPGATALTRTPATAHSRPAVMVRLTMPARAAPECPMLGMPFHMSAMMLTMAPPCSSASTGYRPRAPTRKPPVRLLRTTTSQPLALIAAAARGTGRRHC